MDNGKAASFRPKINYVPNYGDAEEAPAAKFPARRTAVMAGSAIILLTLVPLFWSLAMTDREEKATARPAQAETTGMEESSHMAVHDDNGEMVGQLAKMPADMPQVESISQADKNSGKELMKIIGKY